MKKEIGSEFNSIDYNGETQNNIFNYFRCFNTCFMDSGRSALRLFLSTHPVKRVLLPSYICESVRNCFDDCDVNYYRVNEDTSIIWDDLCAQLNGNIDLLYLNFFNGFIDSSYNFDLLRDLKNKYNFCILEDTTHSLFTRKNIIGDYCVASLRKWFPIPDGGILYSKRVLPDVQNFKVNNWFFEKKNAMDMKRHYLLGQDIDKKNFLDIFYITEMELNKQSNFFKMSQLSKDILEHIDTNLVIKKRLENYQQLKRCLKNTQIREIALNGLNQVPLFYTISIKGRDAMRRFLTENGVYCPVHWPLYTELFSFDVSVQINKTELSIPIDQRYGIEDMEYISKILSF